MLIKMNVGLIILGISIIVIIAFVISLSFRKKGGESGGGDKQCESDFKDRKSCQDLITPESGIQDAYKNCINGKINPNCVVICKDKNATYNYTQKSVLQVVLKMIFNLVYLGNKKIQA
jgi:hypothetical protein